MRVLAGSAARSQLERASLFAVFRNLVKRRSERRVRSITPAMWIGFADARWTWDRVFAQRLQPSRIPPDTAWTELYDRRMTTPTLRRTPPHALKLAY